MKRAQMMPLPVNELVRQAHDYAVRQGFWPDSRSHGEVVALIHSEVSELLEAIRAVPCPQEHIAEEMADIMIRVADFAGYFGIDLEAAILRKMAHNETRPYRHGKAF